MRGLQHHADHEIGSRTKGDIGGDERHCRRAEHGHEGFHCWSLPIRSRLRRSIAIAYGRMEWQIPLPIKLLFASAKTQFVCQVAGGCSKSMHPILWRNPHRPIAWE